MQESVEQFVVFEKITIAYLHKIANEIMLLLSSNLQEKRIIESQRAEKRDWNGITFFSFVKSHTFPPIGFLMRQFFLHTPCCLIKK